MTFRLLLCLFWLRGLILLIDLLWSAGNDCRQTLRDMLAGTYVVRKSAAPAEGSVIVIYYFLFGLVFCVLEVQRPRKVGRQDFPGLSPGRSVVGEAST